MAGTDRAPVKPVEMTLRGIGETIWPGAGVVRLGSSFAVPGPAANTGGDQEAASV